MEKVLELRHERDEIIRQARELLDNAENGVLTDEQAEKYEGFKTRAQALKDQEERYILINGLEEEMRSFDRGPQKPETDGKPDGSEEARFNSFGEQLRAVYNAACPGGKVDERLTSRGIYGMSESVPSDGGFLVQKDFVSDLLKRAYETGILVPRCRRVPIGPNANGLKVNAVDETSRATGSRLGGIRGYWVAEGEEFIKSKPKFRQIALDLEKLGGLCYATDELLKDTTALESIISQGFAEEFGFMIDDAIFAGDGAGKPLGIKNSPCLVSVAKETNQAAGTVNTKNISKMWARLWVKSRKNAIWLINQELEPELDELSIAAGTAALEPRFVTYGPDGILRIKNRPVVAIEQAEAPGTKGDITLADFSQYLLIDKGPMESAASIHVRFVYDENTFRFIFRVNGQPIWNSALTPYKGSLSVSPFVMLNDR